MKMNSLEVLLEEQLKDMYSAEKQLLRALPKMTRAASSQELKTALQEHTEVTKRQVERLEQVFESMGKKAKAKTCAAMQGLIEEANEIMSQEGEEAVLDAGIIAAAQKVEHYEIASYGTVRTWARLSGQTEAAELLQETLDEESETDQRLTQLAESFVNPQAEATGGTAERGGSGGSSSGGKKSSSSKNSGGSKKSTGGSKSSGGSKSGGKKSGGSKSRR